MIIAKFMIIPLVLLVALAALLASNPSVTGFFETLKDKFFSISEIDLHDKNIEFSAVFDSYEKTDFDAASPLNITVVGVTNATLANGNINTKQTLVIKDYRGVGTVSDKFVLNGSFDQLIVQDVFIGKDKIFIESDFSVLEIENLHFRLINMSGAAGTLNLANSSTHFAGSIEITELSGTFVFKKEPKSLSITGTAKKISIPDMGIDIK